MRQLAALLAVLVASSLLAPAADAQFRRDKPFAKKGDLALVAQVNGLQLDGFSPALGGVGLRYRLADQTVLGVGFGLNVVDDQYEVRASEQVTQEAGRMSTRVAGAVWMEQHVGSPRRTVSPFVGGGVTASYTKSTNASPNYVQTCVADVCTVEVYVDENDREEVALGAGLLLGAEVRLAKGITLGGAYGLGVTYFVSENQSRSERPEGDRAFSQSRDGYSVDTRSPRLTLSVYF